MGLFTKQNQYTPKFRDSDEAFANAIRRGHLSGQPGHRFYAGNWMYMHTEETGDDCFKNIQDRSYITVLNLLPVVAK